MSIKHYATKGKHFKGKSEFFCGETHFPKPTWTKIPPEAIDSKVFQSSAEQQDCRSLSSIQVRTADYGELEIPEGQRR